MVRRQAVLIASAALVVVLAGCSFEGAQLEPGLRCGDDGVCPGGQSCVAGVCGAPAEYDATVSAVDASIPDADPGAGVPDAGSPDAGDPGCTTAVCPAATLVDDFATGGIGPLWYTWGSPSACVISETGGTIRMSFPGSGTSQYCGIDAAALYDLRSSAIFVDAGGAASANAFSTFLQLSDPENFDDRIEVYRDQNTLYAHQLVGGAESPGQTKTYSASAHRYWRMRGAGGRVYFETSADAAIWAPWFDAAAQIDLSRLVVTLGAGHWQNPGGSVVTSFAGVNVP